MSNFDSELEEYEERFLRENGFCLQKEVCVPSVRRGRPRRYADNAVLSVRLPKSQIVRLYEYCKRNSLSVPELIDDFIRSL